MSCFLKYSKISYLFKNPTVNFSSNALKQLILFKYGFSISVIEQMVSFGGYFFSGSGFVTVKFSMEAVHLPGCNLAWHRQVIKLHTLPIHYYRQIRFLIFFGIIMIPIVVYLVGNVGILQQCQYEYLWHIIHVQYNQDLNENELYVCSWFLFYLPP